MAERTSGRPYSGNPQFSVSRLKAWLKMADQVFTSHKTRSANYGVTELAITKREAVHRAALSVSTRASQVLICERFIYLAASNSNQIVKVGMSANPIQRVPQTFIGKRWFFTTYAGVLDRRGSEPLKMLLVRAWSLGVVTRQAALDIERGLHRELRELSQWNHGEWYRLRTTRAVTLIDQYLGLRRSA